MRAGALEVGHQISDYDSGTPLTVTAIETDDRQATVYNLAIHGDPNYFAGELGALSHNVKWSVAARDKATGENVNCIKSIFADGTIEMIDRDLIQARIRRSRFPSLAEKFYINEKDRELSERLSDKPVNDLLFALYKSEDEWTAVSTRELFYKVGDSTGKMRIDKAGELFHRFSSDMGKEAFIDYVIIDDKNKIWVINTEILCALQNIFLLLRKYI